MRTVPPKTVVVTQSNYIPWRGFFDLVRRADELILLDSVQYTRRDWRNRNAIVTKSGLNWLTIPVSVKGKFDQSIKAVKIVDPAWAERHIRAIDYNYRRAGSFEEVAPWLFAGLRRAAGLTKLSDVNRYLVESVCAVLSIGTTVTSCVDVLPQSELQSLGSSERIARLCEAVGGTQYLSGPAAHSYLDVSCFSRRKIAVRWMSYDGYTQYSQCWPGFSPNVSIIDTLLNQGFDASKRLIRPAGTLLCDAQAPRSSK